MSQFPATASKVYSTLGGKRLSTNTLWAADFETPVGSRTFSSFSLATSAEINNK
jgi:hypothetical protein